MSGTATKRSTLSLAQSSRRGLLWLNGGGSIAMRHRHNIMPAHALGGEEFAWIPVRTFEDAPMHAAAA
jgi:hypothetical protein